MGSGQSAAQALQLAVDSDLEFLIAAWPTLSAERRSCIIAIADQ